MSPGADQVVAYLADLFGTPLPIRIRLWDGSEAGPAAGATLCLRSPRAVRHLLWAPGELGVARAYVTGDLDVEGDFEAALRQVLATVGGRSPRLTLARLRGGLQLIRALGGIGLPPPRPESEARPRGRRHSLGRDARVISHHYDLSNRFYSLLLDPSLAYSCAYWTSDGPGYGLEDAQRDKLDLVCRKLALNSRTTLLDLGCGWGSLTVHAARHYGTSVTAVTVSAEQHRFVAERVAAAGVGHLVDLRLCHYRELMAAPDRRYQAVAAIEMSEHVGEEHYPAFLDGVKEVVDEGGRFLLQVMSRPGRHPGGGPFIERYIAPDMHMRPRPDTLRRMAAAGLEVVSVEDWREHYARTIRAWHARLEEQWAEVVELIGVERARVWRLYLIGGALSFEAGRMGVDQILARPATSHRPARTAALAAGS